MPVPTNVMPGDFVLVSFDGRNPNLSDPSHWLKNGGLIRLGQWLNGDGFAQYEHAALYIGQGYLIEAQSSGVNYAPANRYDANDTLWSSGILVPSARQRSAIVDAARGYLGTPYSWPDYAALAAKRLHLGPLVPGLKAYVADTHHMICSQLVDQCWHDAGVELFTDHRWPGYVTPADLFNLLANKRG